MKTYLCVLSFFVFIFYACNPTEPEFSGNNIPLHASFNKIINASEADLIINSTSDEQDVQWNGNGYEVPGPDGLLTLKEAILLSNYYPGRQKIAFNIPTTDPRYQNGVFIIKPMRGFDIIEDEGVILDGATQTEYTGNTNPSGPEIVLDGSLMTEGTGVRLHSSNNQINSLVINNFNSPGIDMDFDGIRNNKVTGCYIGTDPTGTIAQPNNWIGIHIVGTNSVGHIIGGSEEWQRNVISGNYNDGIQIHFGVTNCIIQGNYIGTDATGTRALGNENSGISLITSVDEPTGSMKIFDNLVSGNGWDGINITSFCVVKGNLIGTDKNGNPGLGNGGNGIRFSSDWVNPVSCNIIGGDEGDGNIIRSNGGNGIFCSEFGSLNARIIGNIIANNNATGIALENSLSSGNLFSQNSIYDNGSEGGGLGIDLHIDGVTYNDPGDIDTGPNRLLNFPVLDKIKLTHGRLIIQGDVDAEARGKLTVEIYANHSADPSGYGEGEIFLGSKQTNPHGKFTLTFSPIDPGMYITLLAIDEDNNTSEFSFAYLVE